MSGWRAGDPVGRRQFLHLEALGLESGRVLPDVRIAYETWGTLDPDGGNAVLVCHALTGDSHVSGPAGPGHPTPGWWDALVGPGKAVDTRTWYVVTANVLGGCQGSTGPSSPAPDGRAWGSRFPRITIRDQVAAELALTDALGVERWAAVLGGSMGGMRALEWAATAPQRLRGVLVLAAPAASSAEQIAWCATQLAAIRSDPSWLGGDYHDAPDRARPDLGLGIARQIAHVTYRSEAELAGRFGRAPQEREDPARGGRYAVESYLDHQATKLVRRFDAGSYVTLTEAMKGHDVGRDRGGARTALAGARAAGVVPVVVAIDTDRLYPRAQQAEVAALLDTELSIVHSDHGHDGFLLEAEQVGGLVASLLARAAASRGGQRLGPRADRPVRGVQAAVVAPGFEGGGGDGAGQVVSLGDVAGHRALVGQVAGGAVHRDRQPPAGVRPRAGPRQGGVEDVAGDRPDAGV